MIIDTPALPTISVRTLPDRVTEILRERILSGALAGGRPIRQDVLASELGVSKIPIREALTRLEQDGLVTSHPNRGYMVSRISAHEAEEVFDLRLKLEPHAIICGSRRASDADRVNARIAFTSAARRMRAGSDDQCMFRRSFHMALMQPGTGRVTILVLERLGLLADRYLRLYRRSADQDAGAAAELGDIFASWLERDTCRLEQLITAHLARTRADLLARFDATAADAVA